MQRHPAVRESLAFGRPDPRVQEVITMVVVLNDGYKARKNAPSNIVDIFGHVCSVHYTHGKSAANQVEILRRF